MTSPQRPVRGFAPVRGACEGAGWALAAAGYRHRRAVVRRTAVSGISPFGVGANASRLLGAALIATALWTSLHIGYTAIGIIEVSLIGLFFSWLLWRTGSLRVAIFCHAVYNSLIVLSLRFVDLPTPT